MKFVELKSHGGDYYVVAENIANADSTGLTPGAEPYRRKTITFKNVLEAAAHFGGEEVLAI